MGLYSSRWFEKFGPPFTEIGHHSFHRFMDWMATWEITNHGRLNTHFYDYIKFSPTGYSISPGPYGILVFWLMWPFTFFKYGMVYSFLIAMSGYLYTLFQVFKEATKTLKNLDRYFIFIALLVGTYALWYQIDRASIDVVMITLFNLIILNQIKWKNKFLTIILAAIIVSMKPSFGFFGLLVLLPSISSIQLISLCFIVLIYLMPMLIWGLQYDYLIKLVDVAYPMISGMNFLCHNITCSIRVFYPMPNDGLDKLITISSFFISIIFLVYLKFFSKISDINKMNIMIFFCVLVETMVYNPSPDYRLIMFIPLFILLFNNYSQQIMINRKIFITLCISFCLILGFINIPILGLPNYFTVLRTLGIVSFFFVSFYLIYKNLKH